MRIWKKKKGTCLIFMFAVNAQFTASCPTLFLALFPSSSWTSTPGTGGIIHRQPETEKNLSFPDWRHFFCMYWSFISLQHHWTMSRIVQNKLWKGENRSLPVHRQVFKQKIGWTPTVWGQFLPILDVAHMICNLAAKYLNAWILCLLKMRFHKQVTGMRRWAPRTQTPMYSREKTIVENFWGFGWKQAHGCLITSAVTVSTPVHRALQVNWGRAANMLKSYTIQTVWVKIDPVREMYQQGIGAHPDQSMTVLALAKSNYWSTLYSSSAHITDAIPRIWTCSACIGNLWDDTDNVFSR